MNIICPYLQKSEIMTKLKDARSKQISICYCVKIMSKLAPVGLHLLSQRMTTGPDLPRMTFDWASMANLSLFCTTPHHLYPFCLHPLLVISSFPTPEAAILVPYWFLPCLLEGFLLGLLLSASFLLVTILIMTLYLEWIGLGYVVLRWWMVWWNFIHQVRSAINLLYIVTVCLLIYGGI